MSLLDLFDPSLVGRATAPALEFESRSGATVALTFGDLESRSNRLAAALRARGLRRGDRLAFFLANRVEVIDLWLACTKLGVITVPINVLYREREIRHIVEDADPTAVVTSTEHAALFPGGVARWDVDELHADAEGRSAERSAALGDMPQLDLSQLDMSSPAALVYTSGTTGASKGAVLTHGNFASNARSLIESWRIGERDRFLLALPLFHVHGLGNGLHCWLGSGCHTRLVERFEAERAAGWFTSYRPTLFFGVPTMYVRLLDVPSETAREIGARARLFVSGSAPLAPSVLEAFAERYGHTILERYGMTETLMNTSNPYDGERRAGTVGPALPGVRLRVRDERGDDVPDGTAGELWVNGPNVCSGYWRRPDATTAAFVDGWFRTGDVGTRGHDGYITLQGRRSDLIISGGFNIYPREIEELLAEQPGVREAAVVGVADATRGEIPVAYLVTDRSYDPATVERTVRSQLASFKVPRAFVRVEALPRTALGKVQKHLLPVWTPVQTPE